MIYTEKFKGRLTRVFNAVVMVGAYLASGLTGKSHANYMYYDITTSFKDFIDGI